MCLFTVCPLTVLLTRGCSVWSGLAAGSAGVMFINTHQLATKWPVHGNLLFPWALLGHWGMLVRDETISSCGEPSVNSPWAGCPALLFVLARNPHPLARNTKPSFCQYSARDLSEEEETKQ